MDNSKLMEMFDAETLCKLADVITPTATREKIAEGAAKLGISLSEEQLGSICELITGARELSEGELAAITGGRSFLYRKKDPNVNAPAIDWSFAEFLKKLGFSFNTDQNK